MFSTSVTFSTLVVVGLPSRRYSTRHDRPAGIVGARDAEHPRPDPERAGGPAAGKGHVTGDVGERCRGGGRFQRGPALPLQEQGRAAGGTGPPTGGARRAPDGRHHGQGRLDRRVVPADAESRQRRRRGGDGALPFHAGDHAQRRRQERRRRGAARARRPDGLLVRRSGRGDRRPGPRRHHRAFRRSTRSATAGSSSGC
ncbi:Uncharacterised protein [Mycobacteroides abscessus subsp. abscessus]|nr:Uncharacterised protein [Mycobacteroides abscessus subsp. abscessus]